jgi:membrane-bound ClpP family serine protease
MEIAYVVLIVIFGFLLFELIEHLVIPVVFYVRKRKQQSVTGIESMPGELVDIRQWERQEGQVFFRGEMWKAVSEVSFKKRDKAVIQQVEGLILKVKPISKDVCEKK